MRWTPGRRSPDLEDRRATTGGRRIAIPFGGGGLGIGGLLILLVLSFIFKTDLLSLFSGGGASVQVPGGETFQPTPEAEKLVDFVSFVLDDTQTTWDRIFQQSGRQYQHAKLVVYREGTDTGCGYGEAVTGPFYCPNDSTVYIDLSFYKELKDRFGAPGDFAQAY